MRLIHRYILGQVLLYAAMSIGVFVFVLLAGSAIREILALVAGGKIGFGIFLKLLFILIPYLLAYALPLGLLMAILLVLGRLSAQREITAMKAAGMSLWSIASPIILLAVIGTVSSVMINLYYKPIARRTYTQMLETVVKEDPLGYIQAGVFIKDFPGYVIYVGEKSGRELKDFWVWELDSAQRPTVLLRAQRGEFLSQEDGIVLNMFNGTAEARSEKDPEKMQDVTAPMLMFDSSSVKLPWEHILKKASASSSQKLSRLTFGELLAMRAELKKQKDPESWAKKIKVQVQIQQNFVNSFGVLALALIGIPLGIKSSRKETFANLAIALLAVLVYYGFVTLINTLGSQPNLRPDLLIWIPNILFTSLGLYFMVRVNRH